MKRISVVGRRWIWTLVAALALAACGSGEDGTGEPAGERPAGTALLGTAGGTVHGTDGARVDVPAGALGTGAAQLSINIAKDSTDAPPVPPGLRPLGSMYAVTPHGLQFQAPVTVSVPFDAAALPAGRKPALLKVTPGRPWQLIENVTVDGSLVKAQVTSLSYFVPVSAPFDGWLLQNPVSPPPPTQAALTLRVENSGWTSFPPTGTNARIVQQPAVDQPAQVDWSVVIPEGSDLMQQCWTQDLRVRLMRQSAVVYRLPTDPPAGTNRVAVDPNTDDYVESYRNVTVAFRSLVSSNTATDTWAPRPPSTGLSALLGPAADIPANAIIDSIGSHFRLLVQCVQEGGGSGGLFFGDTASVIWEMDNAVPPVVVVRGFTPPRIAVREHPVPRPVFNGQSVEANNTPGVEGYLPMRARMLLNFPRPQGLQGTASWERAAAGSNAWVAVPSVLSEAEAPAGGIYSLARADGVLFDETILQGVASAATDNGAQFRARFCLAATATTPAECATSRPATLTVASQYPQPRITTQPRSQTFQAGRTMSLGVAFDAFPLPLVVTWQTRTADDQPWQDVDPAVWLNVLRPGFQYDPFMRQYYDHGGDTLVSTRTLTVADRGRQFRAVFTTPGGTATSQAATINVTTGLTPPSITTQPQDLSVGNGQTAVFTALADGAAPLSYQWTFNGTRIPGANAPTLALGSVNAGNAGLYVLEVGNAEDTVRSRAARLTVGTGGATPPPPLGIVSGPAAQSVQAGGNAAFAVVATGAPPVTYRWERNGQPVVGAVDPVLSLTGVTAGQAGDYVAVVSDASGATARSLPARLTVQPVQPALQPPTIVTPPVGLTVVQGQRAVLAVGASGGGSLAFQWSRGGSVLPGATSPVLEIAAAGGSDAGNYTVTITNEAGSVTSSAAGLVVVPPPGAPTITLQPGATLGTVGGVARFTATVAGDPAPLCLWLRNGIVIPGATSCTGYTTDALTLADNGVVFNVFAYNAGGHVFGNGALLTVTTAVPPVITTQPSAQAWGSGGIVFTVAATGTPAPTIDWAVDRERIGTGGRYVLGGCSFDFSTGGGTLTLTGVAEACIGSTFMAIASNVAGRVESNTVALIAPGVFATRIAGLPGTTGSADGAADAARFNTPNYLALARDGRIAIGDFGNSTIRLVAVDGSVSTLAGSAGVFAFADGTGSAARFNGSGGVAYDSAGNLFVSDWDNHVIRRIAPDGVVSTVAGSPGVAGSDDGSGAAARFRNPNGLAIDGADNLYVVDWGNHTIRKITPAGEVSTFAGTAGQVGSADGTGAAARFRTPGAVAIDGAGNLYVTDMFNHTVRKITPAAEVSTLAGQPALSGTADGTGSAARFDTPAWIAATPGGTLFVVSAGGDTVRRVSPGGVVDTVVGVLGDNTALRLGSDPRLRNARGVWAVGEKELLLNADQSVIRVQLP